METFFNKVLCMVCSLSLMISVGTFALALEEPYAVTSVAVREEGREVQSVPTEYVYPEEDSMPRLDQTKTSTILADGSHHFSYEFTPSSSHNKVVLSVLDISPKCTLDVRLVDQETGDLSHSLMAHGNTTTFYITPGAACKLYIRAYASDGTPVTVGYHVNTLPSA